MTKKKRVLFIDDDKLLGDVLTRKIEKEGYEVILVTDGAEGLHHISSDKPDLVLLDILLPTMTGYEVLEAKQKDPTLTNIPIIIISDSGQPVDMERARTLGVKDYLIKARLDPQEVMNKINSYLGGPEAGDKGVKRLAGQKILWVEDDQFLSSILAVKLSHEGCVGFYAKNGEEALEILSRETPDIILLDLLLPGMTGFEVLQAIRANSKMANVPIIVLSNLGQKEDMEKTKELGATKYLIKAEHDLDDIVNEVAKALAQRAAPPSPAPAA
ncbi:response regulator [Candidatus Kaiserbacteria bacterium]|nr:response regulator [Candidatus Kaiserbacteria bacterium]